MAVRSYEDRPGEDANIIEAVGNLVEGQSEDDLITPG